ncbi:hypothetical protein [Acinetobacter bereziniae]|uniref:hypothetical protein n=1 Tax=Acinetobacter bereziniae TaxID=106648 RepID=UPI0012504561|nr:hypothetical protein [Acinetobacter bereziniae]MCU4320678.1 hypothetical protein [Acinetobacter bereziniae]
MLNKDQIASQAKEQASHVALTGRFMTAMAFDKPPKDGVSYGAQFDSLVASAIEGKVGKASFMPASLLNLEEKLTGKVLPNGKGKAFNAILDSIASGCQAYRNRNGGDMPNASLVASALATASLLYDGLDSTMTNGLYDSANNSGSKLTNAYFMDSVNSNHSAHTAEVPALAMVTIATTIANAMPVVAYLPNPKGTQTVPLVYVRQVARMDYGQMRKDDFLDGARSAGQYFDAVHRFAMTPDADRKVFTVKTARCVLDKKTLEVDAQSGDLPIVAGATTIMVGGMPFANDEQNHNTSGAISGDLQLLSLSQNGVTLAGESYKLVQGKVTLGKTGEITVTFDKAIPDDVAVIANVVADYEARDASNNYILSAPSVDAKLEYSSVTAYAIRSIYTATIDALTQMQNELGVDMRSAFIALVISKLMLEQNCRLLRQARDRAIGQGSQRGVDLTRGSDMTQAFNTTASIASEIIPALEEAKRRMIGKSSHAPVGFDVYVTGTLSTLMKTLADDTNFIPTGLTMGLPNSIVRIGSRGSDNFYYVPEEAEVLTEVNSSGKIASEMLIVARNAEPAKSVFVGHIAVPVITDDVLANAFERGVQFYTRQASEMNKNSRFGGQVFILKVLNLPASLTSPI